MNNYDGREFDNKIINDYFNVDPIQPYLNPVVSVTNNFQNLEIFEMKIKT